ncbi:hypothetical protein RHMOL_Rhmol02G0179100 [Rhododendron molle]|uniref:Uncharacterized protein n=1 Tax=Rhododendron molle TaxID=49168 RepID=A0ACC0PSU0_RHOML|nr:hypothetical protein RHMOL_Rhmol02G0179100 [Rhododendron molle]
MTITPGDFSLLTGLRVGGDSLRVDPRLWERVGALEWFLGKVPPLHSRGHVDVAWLSKTFMKAEILTHVSVEQLTRAFLLYLLGQTLFANKDGSVHAQFLAPLQHLEAIREFDWGSSTLATLYGNFGACSRDKKPILSGHYRILELWAFEHLLQFPSETKHGDVDCIPRYERWFPYSYVVADLILVLQVRFDPWGGVPEDAPLARSRKLDCTRSLLEGPFCRAWYLGDRGASQWRPRAEVLQFVPPSPPASMRSTSSMSKEDLKNARIRDWAGLLSKRKTTWSTAVFS